MALKTILNVQKSRLSLSIYSVIYILISKRETVYALQKQCTSSKCFLTLNITIQNLSTSLKMLYQTSYFMVAEYSMESEYHNVFIH